MKSSWEDREKRKYDNAYGKWKWGDICHFPKMGYDRWVRIINVTAYSFNKWIDVGCGPAYGIAYGVRKELDVYGSDISSTLREKYWIPQGLGDRCVVAPAHRQPFVDGKFDFTACFETLEHIPEEGVVESLKELRRISNGVFCYSIALTTDKGPLGLKWKKSHLTVKPKEWWLEKLQETGHNVVQDFVRDMTEEDKQMDVHRSLFVLGYFGSSKKKADNLTGKFF
jgi:ubiquinone/menaquinone biosynthesis C-methylase UbiE